VIYNKDSKRETIESIKTWVFFLNIWRKIHFFFPENTSSYIMNLNVGYSKIADFGSWLNEIVDELHTSYSAKNWSAARLDEIANEAFCGKTSSDEFAHELIQIFNILSIAHFNPVNIRIWNFSWNTKSYNFESAF